MSNEKLNLISMELIQKNNLEIKKGIKIDIDEILKYSVQNGKSDKRIIIKGSLYKGKSVNKNLIKRTAIICALVASSIAISKSAKYQATLDEYNYQLNKKIFTELDSDQREDYLENYDKNSIKKYDTYKESLKELEKSMYDIGGHRVDGTKNEYYNFEKGSLFNLTEKEVDAIDNATSKDIEEFKGSKK